MGIFDNEKEEQENEAKGAGMALRYKAMATKMFARMTELDGEIGPYEVKEHEILNNIVDQVHELATLQAHIEMRKDEIDINTILTADDPCRMEDSKGRTARNALTVDRNYAIQYFQEIGSGKSLVVIDDSGDEHDFTIDELEKWFSWTLLEWKHKDQIRVNNRRIVE